MWQRPDHSSRRGPSRRARAAVRARAEQLRAVFEAADTACQQVTRVGGVLSGTLRQQWVDAEQQMCDYVIDHYEDLKGVGWAESIYSVHVLALKDAVDAAYAQIVAAREAVAETQRMELAALVARPEDVTQVGQTTVFHYGVEEIIKHAIDRFVDEVLAEGLSGPDDLEGPGL